MEKSNLWKAVKVCPVSFTCMLHQHSSEDKVEDLKGRSSPNGAQGQRSKQRSWSRQKFCRW